MKEGEVIQGEMSINIDDAPYAITYIKRRVNNSEFNGIEISAVLANYKEPNYCNEIKQIRFYCDGSRIREILYDKNDETSNLYYVKTATQKIADIIYDKVMPLR